MVDFGMDLAACIIMFEKPMGVWAIIEEESLFPKATDKTLEDKLKSTHLGKTPSFVKPQSKTDKNAHFAIVHYAGTVSYNVTGWLEKNKDPVNDTVVDIMKNSSTKLLVRLWQDHPGQSNPPEEKKGKKKKGGGSKTVSGVFLAGECRLSHGDVILILIVIVIIVCHVRRGSSDDDPPQHGAALRPLYRAQHSQAAR